MNDINNSSSNVCIAVEQQYLQFQLWVRAHRQTQIFCGHAKNITKIGAFQALPNIQDVSKGLKESSFNGLALLLSCPIICNAYPMKCVES